jgi:hypothetical protein
MDLSLRCWTCQENSLPVKAGYFPLMRLFLVAAPTDFVSSYPSNQVVRLPYSLISIYQPELWMSVI